MESGGAEEFSEFSDYSLIYVLPHEIIISIFRKLPISELSFTIPSVCKQWYIVSTDSLLWRELYAEQWQTIPQGLRQQLSLSPRKGGKRFARFTLMPPRREKSNASCLALENHAAPVTHDALKIALDSIAPLEFPLDDSGDDSGDESCDSSSEDSYIEEVLDAASASPRMLKRRAANDGYATDDEAKDLFSSGESDTETRCSTPPSVSEVTPIPSEDEFEETIPKETELNWKSLFLERLAGEANWRDGNYTVSTLKGHSLAIMSVKFVDDTVYSCSLDGTIKTWNMSSNRCTTTFNGHTDWVNSFDFDATASRVDRLVSCSFDTTIKLWDTKKVECLSTLWGHQNIVWSVKMADNKLVSCSSDSTMRIWDIEAGTCINTLTGHEGAIYCMYYDKERNIAVSGCQDKTVRFWDLNGLGESNGGCVGVLRGHADRLCCLQWDGDQSLLVTGSHDSSIKLWDARMLEADDGSISINVKSEEDERNNSAACLKTFTGHKGRVCCLQFDHEKIVSGSDDNKIKVWSLNGKEECINTLADHDYWVNTLYFKDNMLVSGAADDTIKIWDFSAKRRRGGKGGVNAFEANGVLGKAAKKVKEHKWKDGLSNLANTASTFDWGTPSFSLAQTLSVADRCMIA